MARRPTVTFTLERCLGGPDLSEFQGHSTLKRGGGPLCPRDRSPLGNRGDPVVIVPGHCRCNRELFSRPSGFIETFTRLLIRQKPWCRVLLSSLGHMIWIRLFDGRFIY